MNDKTLILRAQEIINKAGKPMGAREAIKIVLRERALSYEEMLDVAAGLAQGAMRALRKSTFDLPDQDGLFDIPAVISNSTPDGPLFISRDQANVGQVRQWVREGRAHHAIQHLRFKRAADEMTALDDIADEIPWSEARCQLESAAKVEIDQ